MKPGWIERMGPIRADPQADAPRIAFAEAIRDEDPRRAALIEAQLRYAAAERAEDDSAYGQLYAAAEALLRPEDAAGLPALGLRPILRRGFVQHITADAGLWLARGAEVRAQHPILELSLGKAEAHLPALLAQRALDGIVSLDLAGSRVGDEGAALLADAPGLSTLRWLDLRRNGVSRQGLDRLCASPLGRRLRWLHLRLPGEGTPHDEPIEEEGRLIEFLAPPLGMELEARHGPLPFLHAHPRRLRFFPPSMSRFVGDDATRDRE